MVGPVDLRELKFNLQKTNPLGSGISIGHPIGCTGARIILTLVGQMLRHDLEFGLATLCIGGGQGMATVLQRIQMRTRTVVFEHMDSVGRVLLNRLYQLLPMGEDAFFNLSNNVFCER